MGFEKILSVFLIAAVGMCIAVIVFSLELLFGAEWSCCCFGGADSNKKKGGRSTSYLEKLFSGGRARERASKFFNRQQEAPPSNAEWARGRETLDRVLEVMSRHPEDSEALAFELEMVLKRLRESLAARRGQQFGMEGSGTRQFGFASNGLSLETKDL